MTGFYRPQQLRVSSFSHVENEGDVSSRLDLLSERVVYSEQAIDYDFACCHFGGSLDFAPDGSFPCCRSTRLYSVLKHAVLLGTLYFAIGDLFNGENSQDGTTARGKLLRINKDGSIPSDNWGARAGPGYRDEIVAMGLRNPFSGRFDPVTGLLIVAEVGGNNQATAIEDLHYYDPAWTRDVNFGRRISCET
jgi:hypothetical protein